MKNCLIVITSITLMSSGVAFAGPLKGVERNIDRNGAMSMITGSDGKDYAATEGNGVLLGSDVIGVKNGQGGVNASENSVVSPWEATNCTGSTRVDLPGGGGTSC